jgi:hypothetical protein
MSGELSVQFAAYLDHHLTEPPRMCSPTRCNTCRKTTWTGCGSHVDQVMRRVPHDQRCGCSAEERDTRGALARFLSR